MDNMLEHPWIELQVLIKEKWLTQKAFASILWKKVSEVNELLKWKRNITIQRDYLLHQVLWTPIKYWILKQIDYDYSLLDIEEADETWTVPSPGDWKSHKSSLSGEDLDGVWRGLGWGSEDKGEVSSHNDVILSDSEESIGDNTSSWASVMDLGWETEELNIQDSSSQAPLNDNIMQTNHSEHSEESISHQTSHSEPEGRENPEISPLDKGDRAKPRGFEQPQEIPAKEQNSKDDEDLKNRAKIFRSF